MHRAVVIGLAVSLALTACEACKNDTAPEKPKIYGLKKGPSQYSDLIKHKYWVNGTVAWKSPKSTNSSGCFSYAEYQNVENAWSEPNDWYPAPLDDYWKRADGDKLNIDFVYRSVWQVKMPWIRLRVWMRSVSAPDGAAPTYSDPVLKVFRLKTYLASRD